MKRLAVIVLFVGGLFAAAIGHTQASPASGSSAKGHVTTHTTKHAAKHTKKGAKKSTKTVVSSAGIFTPACPPTSNDPACQSSSSSTSTSSS
ncbi:MAG TPA: hypothetical protein VF221_06650, partial [Chloroflexota bacterium]